MDGPVRGVFAGLTTLDIVHVMDELPGPDEKRTASDQYVQAGGPAAAAAVSFAALGGEPVLITALGRHPLADVVRADLTACGVGVVDVLTSTDPPPVSAVRVHPSTGRRSVSSSDGAGVELGSLPDLPALLADADVALVDGHHPRLGRAVVESAELVGVPVVVDAGRWRPVFTEILPLAQFAVCSAAFTATDGRDVLAALLDHGVPAVARTAGPQPIRWATVDGEGTVPVDPVSPADTLGAGDVLHGAVAYAVGALGVGPALALWPQVLGFGAQVATLKVSRARPRAWHADPRLSEWTARWTQPDR